MALEAENYTSAQISTATSFYELQLASSPTPAAAYATQTVPILNVQYTTVVVYDNVNNFSAAPVNNTILKAMNSSDPLATILQDCIPCLGRTLNLANINPLDDFIILLEDEIAKRWAYINGLWQSMGSSFNVCDLLNYFNSLCIPDLFALLAALTYYWVQLMSIFKLSIWNILWSLIQPLLQSILTGLDALLQKFIMLIMGPIDCIITSINHEYAKIYNLTNMSASLDKGITLNHPYDNSFSQWAQANVRNPILNGSSYTYGMGLMQLRQYALDARNYINAQLLKLRNSIKEVLGINSGTLSESQGLFLVMRWLSLVIGLIRAIIKFKQDGFSCGAEGLSEPQYLTLISYLQDATGMPFEIVPDTTDQIITPWIPDTTNPDGNTTPGTPLTPNDYVNQVVQTAVFQSLDPETIADRISSGQAVSVPNCIQVRNQLERSKVADWQAALDAITV